ncbi:hypothetical protein H4219_005600 [Mycoemilia scoparia]|uniref:Uncharacterized protein n=1 Tax=Mycoemilia scoparia TaxID=417184 RepID=A0A9W7ZMA8_9FUNG|nr:hypothetical protein H4219_005600 [Mycoemilia scoparia]
MSTFLTLNNNASYSVLHQTLTQETSLSGAVKLFGDICVKYSQYSLMSRQLIMQRQFLDIKSLEEKYHDGYIDPDPEHIKGLYNQLSSISNLMMDFDNPANFDKAKTKLSNFLKQIDQVVKVLKADVSSKANGYNFIALN